MNVDYMINALKMSSPQCYACFNFLRCDDTDTKLSFFIKQETGRHYFSDLITYKEILDGSKTMFLYCIGTILEVCGIYEITEKQWGAIKSWIRETYKDMQGSYNKIYQFDYSPSLSYIFEILHEIFPDRKNDLCLEDFVEAYYLDW